MARRSRHEWPVAALVGLALYSTTGAAPTGDQPRYAIRAGKVVTITRGVIDHGVVLVGNGKIEAVGAADEVEVPEGYEVIDAADKWLMPGMIEIHSHAGVEGGLNDMVVQTNPGLRIGDGVNPESEVVDAALAAGITTIQSLPGSGTNHAGFGVAFKTAGATKEERILRRISSMKIAQGDNPERRGGDIGATLMGMSWMLREHLSRARAYDSECTAYEEGQRDRPPERDIAMEPARGVFRGELPVMIHTWQTWGMTMTMHMFGDEFPVHAIATHATGAGHRTGQEVAARGFRIDVGPRVVDFYGKADGRCYGIAATYYKAGARNISVNTDQFGFNQAYLADKAAMAARFGMDEETALRLVTINAAEALMLDDRVGSIDEGKDADLVVKGTSLLDPTTPVEMVFVNGQLAYRRNTERSDAKH